MRMTRVSLVGLCLLLLAQVNSLHAQGPAETYSGNTSVDAFSGGMQLGGTGGYMTFRKVVGDGAFFSDSYQNFGAFLPLFRMDDGDRHTMLFSSIDLLLTDHQNVGANGSVGLRMLRGEQIFGGSFTYDTIDSRNGNRFNQVSMGLEYLRPEFDLRANAYIPVGNDAEVVAPVSISSNPVFKSNQILFPGVVLYEDAMEGADAEFAVPLFGKNWLKAGAGVYYYNANNEDDPVGVRGRLTAWLSSDTSIDFTITEDRISGTNLNLFVTLMLSGDPCMRVFPNRTMYERMYEPIVRNDRVAIQNFKDDVDAVAINPRTGLPYTVIHVDNTNPDPGDGSFEDPFNTLPTIAPPDADIILVNTGTGTVFQMNQGIVLSNFQRLLGEGLAHQFDATADLYGLDLSGTFGLPGLTDTFDFPNISNIGGDAVTLASFNEVSAFDIPAASGNGIAGNGITNFNINHVNIGLSGGGIVLNNAVGMGNITQYNSVGNDAGGIVITNTNSSTLDLLLNPQINLAGGSVGVSLTADNSRINVMADSIVAPLNGDGLRFTAVDGGRIDAVVVDSTINGSNASGTGIGNGVSVVGNAGTVNLNMSDNTVILSANNGLDVNLQNGASFNGNIEGTTFSNSGNNGIQVTMGGPSSGMLALTGTQVNNAGVDNFNAMMSGGSDLVVNIFESSFISAGEDAFDLTLTGASTTLGITIDTSPASNAGVNGFAFNLDGGAALMANISKSVFSGAGGNGILGVATNSSRANLMVADTPADNVGGNGVALDFDTMSMLNATFLNGSFDNAGQFGMLVNMANGATGTATFLGTTADDAGVDGMHLDVSGGANLTATVTNGSFNNAGDNAIESIVNGGTLDLTVDPTFAMGAENDAVRFVLSNSAMVTADFDDVFAGFAGFNGLLVTATTGSSFEGIFTNGTFANAGQNPISVPASDRNAVFLDADASLVDVIIENTPMNNTPGNMTQENGLLFSTSNAGTLLVDVINSSMSNNLTNAVQGTVTGAGSSATLVFDGSSANDSGDEGVNIDVSAGGALSFTYDDSSISRSGGTGVLSTIAGAGSTALYNFNGTIIDNNGQDPMQGGDGVNANPNTGGVVTANFVGGSISGNREQGVDVDVMDVSTANFTFNNTAVNGNLNGEGLSFDATGGGTFTGDATGGSFSNNGSLTPADGVRGLVSGAGSSGSMSFDGTEVDGNTINGIHTTVNMGGMLAVNVEGGSSASNNPNGSGLRVDATDAGTVAIVTSTGSNVFDNNGTISGSDGVDINATGIAQLTAMVSGSASNSGANGMDVTASDVMLASISVGGANSNIDMISNNPNLGINIDLTNIASVTNLSVRNASVSNNISDGVRIMLDNTVVSGGSMADLQILENGGSGVEVELTNDSTFINNVVRSTVTNNFDFGYRLTADSGMAHVTIGSASEADSNTFANGNVSISFELSGTAVGSLDVLNNVASISSAGGTGIGGGQIDPGGPLPRPGFAGNMLAANDDGSTGLVPIGFDVNFFGQLYTDLFVNNNGNVTFDAPLGIFTPFSLLSTATPIIAPFFADVDTRLGNTVTYGMGSVGGQDAFGVNYLDVRHFSVNGANAGLPTNSFQLVLIDRSDITAGDFDIEFNYANIDWEAGTASGSDEFGLGGSSARVGYSNGVDTAFELPGSAINGAFLDSGPAATSLVNNGLNSPINGRYIFEARSGTVTPGGGSGAPGATHGIQILLSDSAILEPSTIDNNSISMNNGNAVLLQARDMSTVQSFIVSNNDMNQNAGNAVLIDIDTPNMVNQLSVTDNTMNNNLDNGASVVLTGATVTNLAVSGNTADTNGANGVNFEFDTVTITNVGVDNNTLTNNPGDGFNSTQVDTAITNYSLINSTLSNNGGDGADFNLTNSSIANLVVDNNTVNGNAGGGITFSTNPSPITGSITNNMISGNTLAGVSFDTVGTMGMPYILDFGQDGNSEMIANNTITGNGAGIVVNLDQNVRFFGNVFGNTVTSNTGVGFGLTANDTAMAFDVRIGAADPIPVTPGNEASNTFDMNRGAAIAFRLLDSSGVPGMGGTFDILNNTITRTMDDGIVSTPFAGEGIFVQVTGSQVLTNGAGELFDSVIDGNLIGSLTDATMGNASHGISVLVNENSTINNLLIGNVSGGNNDDGNVIASNGGHGINFLRQDDAVVNMLQIVDNVIANQATGNGIQLTAQNGQTDPFTLGIEIFDATVDFNEITNNSGIGIHLRAEADALLNANMAGNLIDNNGSDGIRTSQAANDPTDGRAAGGTWDMNTITNNQAHGINLAATGDLLIPVHILNSTITDNGFDGIEVNAAGGTVDIENNLIARNGVNAVMDPLQDGAGIDINMDDLGARIFNIQNNVITENLGDGIEILSSDTGGVEDGVAATILGNVIDDNVGRGIDLLVRQDAELYVTIGDGTLGGRNTIRSNGLEGIYFVSTADPTQSQNAPATDPLSAGGATDFVNQSLAATLDINGNTISGNGEFSTFSGTGIVMRIGTTQSSNEPDPNDGDLVPLTPSPVTARVINSSLTGNFGVDLYIQSFVSTEDPTTGTTWTDADFDDTNYQPDPLARLDFAFTGNTGDSLDVVTSGAFYTGADAVFKNRDVDQTDPGPFPTNANARDRNAQRFADDTAPFNVPNTPAGTEAVGFDYPGVGTSAFRIESNYSTLGFGGDTFTDLVPLGNLFGELPFGWDTTIAPGTFWP